MWFGRVAGVADQGDLLALADAITDADRDAALPEVTHHQEAPTTDVHHEVVPGLEVGVGLTDRQVGASVQDESDNAVGRSEHRLLVDVVAGQISAARTVGAAVDDLLDVQGVSLSGSDVVVVDQFGVPTLRDIPILGQWGADPHGIRGGGSIQQHELESNEDRAGSDQQVRAHPHPAQGHQGKHHEGGQPNKEHGDEDAMSRL